MWLLDSVSSPFTCDSLNTSAHTQKRTQGFLILDQLNLDSPLWRNSYLLLRPRAAIRVSLSLLFRVRHGCVVWLIRGRCRVGTFFPTSNWQNQAVTARLVDLTDKDNAS